MWRDLQELIKYRGLFWALTLRHLSARYRGSSLGFIWSFLNPLCLMLVYTLVFKYYIRFDQVDNYSIFVFCGLLPWIWVTSALTEGTLSLVSSGHLITKSLFPPHILPLVAAVTTLIHFLLSLPLLFLFMWLGGVAVKASAAALPLIVLLHLCFITGLVLMLSAINVFFRDVQHILGNLLTFLFFLCPIVYPAASVPGRFYHLMTLNPFALFTMSYQHVVLDGTLPSAAQAAYLAACSGVALIAGFRIFNHYREGFAELL